MKTLITTLIFCIVLLLAICFSLLARNNTAERHIAEQQAYRAKFENRTITEQMKSIQRQVGCKIIDGEIGTETTPLVNAVVRAEKKREICNQHAIESFARMAEEKQ